MVQVVYWDWQIVNQGFSSQQIGLARDAGQGAWVEQDRTKDISCFCSRNIPDEFDKYFFDKCWIGRLEKHKHISYPRQQRNIVQQYANQVVDQDWQIV